MSISGSSANSARQPEATMGWSSTIRTRIGIDPEDPSQVCPVAASHLQRSRTRGNRFAAASFVPVSCFAHAFRKNCCTVQLDSRVFVCQRLQLGDGNCSGAAVGAMAMWQKLSLRARLNMLLALVLALGLVVNIARLVLEAAPRVQAEDQSVITAGARIRRDPGVGSQRHARSRSKAGPDRSTTSTSCAMSASRREHDPAEERRSGDADRSGDEASRRRFRHGLSRWFTRSRPRSTCRLPSTGDPGIAGDHLAPDRRDGRDLGRHRHPARGRLGDRGRAAF